MEFTINSECLSATVSDTGGRLLSVKDSERTEYMWQGDKRFWSGRSFQIFPYVGRLFGNKYLYAGEEYCMEIHGLLPNATMELAEQKERSVLLVYRSNDATKKQYPFDFKYSLRYTLEANKLLTAYEIINTGERTMPYALGFHPAFNVPMDSAHDYEDYLLEFNGECSPRQVNMTNDCFVAGGVSDFSEGREGCISLRHSLFDNDAVVLTEITPSVSLFDKNMKHRISLKFDDFKYLMLWSMPHSKAPFVCVEPVSSLSARKGITEDISQQESLLKLEPGKCFKSTIALTFE